MDFNLIKLQSKLGYLALLVSEQPSNPLSYLTGLHPKSKLAMKLTKLL
jgi:hypothetical protein